MTEGNDEQMPRDREPFACLLPPWWGMVTMGAPVQTQVDQAVERMVPDSLGIDVRTHRAGLRRSIRASVDEMASQGVHAWLYEAEDLDGLRTGASMAVLPMPEWEDTRPIDAVLALATQDATAEVVGEDDRVVVRFTSHSSLEEELRAAANELPDAGQPVQVPDQDGAQAPDLDSVIARARSADYLYFAGDPESDEDWVCAVVTVAATESELEGELMTVMVELFDLIVRSIRLGKEADALT